MGLNEKQILLHKELDLIQACVNRMAQNSFNIKGWYFALIIVISAWKFNNTIVYALIIGFASVIFYILNLQFYIYERRFRVLYNERIEMRCEQDNYEEKLYDLTPIYEKLTFKVIFECYISKNKMLIFMYFGICLLLIIANILIAYENDNSKVFEKKGFYNIF
ncbi:hypothetical protein NCCP2716_31010 [Sporosarcina sp. NCCP-2716]|uniref:hypothetical protein n=1 Tax=Sporosarcina sp. NCCP-2716 TaxID=2943679 RepID=UPI00203E03F7|nr:hypothetical protein [Sporosarcina sp. NCCP-2716]GKV70603.1 hypothetical protein NCCP2716_31010 [Sporosarcina sp. NCCP-2716]